MKRNPAQLELFGPGRAEAQPSIRRVFLGWDRPALVSAAEHLLDRSRDRDLLDLRHLIVVLPVSRAARRLLELLVAEAGARGRALLPPRIITTGTLPAALLPDVPPGASDVVRHLVWAEALRELPSETLGRIIPSPPARDDWPEWVRLGRLVADLQTDLAAGELSFGQARVRARTLAESEDDRWAALAAGESAYAQGLTARGFVDSQRARLEAIERRQIRLDPLDSEIVLVAVADVHATTRRILDVVARQTTALVHAPATLETHFDRYGCAVTEQWARARIDIQPAQLAVAEGAAEQGYTALAALAGLDGRFVPDDVVVGIADPDSATFIEDAFEDARIPIRNAAGRSALQTRPLRLLRAVGEWLTSAEFEALAALARHTDFERWACEHAGLDRGVDWLTTLDRFRSERLQLVLRDDRTSAIYPVHRAIETLAGELRGEPKSLREWSSNIASVIVSVYGDETVGTVEPDVLGACEHAFGVLREYSALPRDMASPMRAAHAIQIVLHELENAQIPESPDRAAVELLGWLELPLDDAPALIVTSFNEQFVPTSLNADPFLPDSMRRHLGLLDNARRYARDAYYLSAMLHSRPVVKLISARTSAIGDPLTPSRLGLAADVATIAQRVLAFYDSPATNDRVTGRLAAGRDRSDLQVPKPLPLDKPIQRLAVTAFRDYIACPYRFYLGRVLHLERLDDSSVELDAQSFGTLAHAVLADFARASIKGSLPPSEVGPFLTDRLRTLANERFGTDSFPAVAIQVAQIRQRLLAFAERQRDWSRSGRTIVHAELQVDAAPFDVDGVPFALRGRIDRVDRDERTGELYILDYKLSDQPVEPDRAHRRGSDWTDLQLPLYRHLLRAAGTFGSARVGYVALPRMASKTDFYIADWDESVFVSADMAAMDVVRRIRSEIFWPPTVPPPPYFDEYSEICQDQQLADLDDPEEAGDP